MKFLLFLLFALPLHAFQVTFEWDANDPADWVTHYGFYSWITQRWVGAQWVPAHWLKLADCGTATTYTLQMSDHYGWFAVTASNPFGHSQISNVVTVTNDTFQPQIFRLTGPRKGPTQQPVSMVGRFPAPEL